LVCLVGGVSIAVIHKLAGLPTGGELDLPAVVTGGGSLMAEEPINSTSSTAETVDASVSIPVQSLETTSPERQQLMSARIEYDYSGGLASARLSRDYSHSRELELLEESLQKLGSEGKDTEIERRLLSLVSAIEMESAAENLIRASGFKDALVIVTDQTVEAIIDSEGLDKADAAVIGGILSRVTGRKLHEIRIKEYRAAL